MPRTQTSPARDEVTTITGETTRLKTSDEWIELTEPVESLPETPIPDESIEARFEINDIVTDAVNVTVLDGEPLPNGDLPLADYELNTFKENTANGKLIPAPTTHN